MRKLFFVFSIVFLIQTAYCQTATEFFEQGKEKANMGKYYAAITDFNKAIEQDPNFAKAYICRAAAKEKTSDFEGAIIDYTKVIEIIPDSYLAFYNRGLAKIVIRQKESACEDFRKALELGYGRAGTAIQDNCQ